MISRHSSTVGKLISPCRCELLHQLLSPGVIYDAAKVSEAFHPIQRFTFQHNGSICDRVDLQDFTLAAREAIGLWHLVQQDSVKHLSRNGQQCYTTVVEAGAFW